MPRVPRSRLVLVVVTALALVAVPMAGARPLDTSQGVHRTGDGWFDAALRWVENLVGFRGAIPGRDGRSASPASRQKSDNSTQGGSCIDPQGGRPRPMMCD